ncbi:HAMP domain-containing histidine kinase [bacterium]|nr:HAMP domain-containing histidine kinase [bacterium]
MMEENHYRDFKFRDRLSYKQARSTVFIAIILGILFSILQIYLDYSEHDATLDSTINQVLNIVEQSASQAAYSLDKEFAIEVISGLFEYKPIFEAAIIDDLGKTLAVIQGSKDLGTLRLITDYIFGETREFIIPLKILPPPVSFTEMGKVIKVGELRVKVDTYSIGITFLERSLVVFTSGMFRNFILSFILLIFFHYFLTKPFQNLERSLLKTIPDHPERIRLRVPVGHAKDEFSRVVTATNNLLVTIQQNTKDRIIRIAEEERMQGELIERKRRQKELEEMRDKLERANQELSAALEDLKATQARLINSEKMAALGEVTASLSHEINTPLGLGVSGASHLHDELVEMEKSYRQNQVIKKDFEEFLAVGLEITEMITLNLRKGYRLIRSFKQIAVDQASETKRIFKVKAYTEQILMSMGNIITKSGHTVTIHCDDNLEIDGYPGAFSQIVNNLVMNSISHAFDDGDTGNITMEFEAKNNKVIFIYSDDGKGIEPKNLDRIFEPFFTTKEGRGGTGLGMQVILDIVTKQYKGTVDCKSEVGKGVTFTIIIQRELPSKGNEISF